MSNTRAIQEADESGSPLVTVITPTYNHSRFIGRCVESVLDQTESRWEQIIIDDGSTDGTGAIIQAIADPRIRYVHQPHQGIGHLADTYNLALALARAPLVAILEGDDYWPPDKLLSQVPAFRDPRIVLSWGQAVEVTELGMAGSTFPDSRLLRRAGGRARGRIIRDLLAGNYIPACTVICRREALARVGGFSQPEGVPNVDYPTWLQLCRVGTIAPAQGVLGYWQRHDAQVSTVMATEMARNISVGTWFVASLSPQERRTLGITLDEARRVERSRRALSDLASARRLAGVGQASEAARLYRSAVRYGSSRTRFKGTAAILALFVGLDLERARSLIARVTRR